MFILRGDARTYNLPPSAGGPHGLFEESWTSSALAAGAVAWRNLACLPDQWERCEMSTPFPLGPWTIEPLNASNVWKKFAARRNNMGSSR